MGRMLKHERDKRQAGSIAEEFHLTHEAKWQVPTLEEIYWKNPNEQKGHISRCLYKDGSYGLEEHYREGI